MGGLSKKSGNRISCCHRTLTARQCGIVLFHFVAITFLTNKSYSWTFTVRELLSFFGGTSSHWWMVNMTKDQLTTQSLDSLSKHVKGTAAKASWNLNIEPSEVPRWVFVYLLCLIWAQMQLMFHFGRRRVIVGSYIMPLSTMVANSEQRIASGIGALWGFGHSWSVSLVGEYGTSMPVHFLLF